MQPIEVAPGVHWCRGSLVNWYLLEDGRDLTLVDAGYPGDLTDVLRSVYALGHQPHDVQAVLLTHAHADHLGTLAALQASYDIPALIGDADLQAARTGVLEQVRVTSALARAWRPSVLRWSIAAIRRGGLTVDAAPRAHAVDPTAGAALDLPGHPVAVPTPGHTPGHTTFHLPSKGVLLTGDALVTGHPTSRCRGPQTLPSMFNADPAQTRDTLTCLARLDANTVLPGHGPPHHGPVDHAVAQAFNPDSSTTQGHTS